MFCFCFLCFVVLFSFLSFCYVMFGCFRLCALLLFTFIIGEINYWETWFQYTILNVFPVKSAPIEDDLSCHLELRCLSLARTLGLDDLEMKTLKFYLCDTCVLIPTPSPSLPISPQSHLNLYLYLSLVVFSIILIVVFYVSCIVFYSCIALILCSIGRGF